MKFLNNFKLELNLLKYKIKYFFYHNEGDLHLFLKKKLKKKRGIYVDVGCYHPIRLSNTKFLYDKGWRGMNIDLSKDSINLFNISRPKDINLNFAIGEKKEKKYFYYNKKLHHANTLNKNFYSKFLKNQNIKKEKINIVPLTFLFEKYLKNKDIDFLDIDVEGHDLQVLKGIDFNKNNINFILIEVHSFDKKTKINSKKIWNLLKKEKYKLIYGKYPGNCIFKKNSK